MVKLGGKHMTISLTFIPLINIAVVAVLVISLIIGYNKGFIWELIRLLGLLAAVFVSWIVSPGLAEIIRLYPKNWVPLYDSPAGELLYQKFNSVTWFLIVLLLAIIILSLVKPLLKAITELPVLKQANGILGAIFSLIPTFVYLLVAVYLLNTVLFKNGGEIVEKSYLQYVKQAGDYTVSFLNKAVSENTAIQDMLYDPDKKTIDLEKIVKWLKDSKLSGEQIVDFLKGIDESLDPAKINELLGN